MAHIQMVDTGVIYINPNPGYEYNFACHSDLVQLSKQELLCTFQRGQALYSADSVMLATRSLDGGKTWTAEGLIHDPAGDDRSYSYHGPMITRVADGSLVVIATRWDRTDREKPLFNEQTGGIGAAQTLLYRSKDKGSTWSSPQIIDMPGNMYLTPSCGIIVLKDGRWMLSTDQWHGYDEPGPYRPRTVVIFSSHEGKTWGDPVTFGVNDTPHFGHWHGRINRLRNDQLFTLFWTANTDTGEAMTHHHCTGSADGREWTVPAPTNIPGQTNWPVDLGNGQMAVIYTVRDTDPPGFFAAVSEDGGKKWDLDRQILVWDATGRDKIGISAPDHYPRSHDTISYGAPTATVLEDGDIFATFWCTEVAVTHIRYARLRVT
jgi:hypothetical protein